MNELIAMLVTTVIIECLFVHIIFDVKKTTLP